MNACKKVHRFQGCKYEASYSPDSQFILFGSQHEPSVQLFDAKSASLVVCFPPPLFSLSLSFVFDHLSPHNVLRSVFQSVWQSDQEVEHIRWNPQFMMVAAASLHLSLWIPVV